MSYISPPTRKISKAVYLLLEKYHRLFGLEAFLFSGPHGPGYVGFQVAANRCWDADNSNANYSVAGPDEGRYGPLVTYLTHVGIPEWAAGHQLEMPDWTAARTEAIEGWLTQNLRLHALFDENADVIGRWRQKYTVEDSEKYLLMYNLAGLLAMRGGDMPRSPSQCLSDYDTKAPDVVQHQLRMLNLTTERGTVMGVSGIMIARNGKALVEETLIDVWQRRTAGESVIQIADSLLALNIR